MSDAYHATQDMPDANSAVAWALLVPLGGGAGIPLTGDVCVRMRTCVRGGAAVIRLQRLP